MQDLSIHTTVTADTVGWLFASPNVIDYGAQPTDNADANSVQIFRDMCKKELQPLSSLAVLKGTVYSPKNRSIIVQWLRDVCTDFALKTTTLCLSVQLTDAYMLGNLHAVAVDRCQLVAVTALWIAAKFEEMDVNLPPLRRIVHVCDNIYSAEAVLAMEEELLVFFRWRLPHVTTANHLHLQLHLLGSEELVQRASTPAGSRTATITTTTTTTTTTTQTSATPSSNTDDASTHSLAASVLTVDRVGGSWRRAWHAVSLTAAGTLADHMPALCAAASMPCTSSATVYQLFGNSLVVAERVEPATVLGTLCPDARYGALRFFLCTPLDPVRSVFVERGRMIILYGANAALLTLCEVLLQVAVVHGEFLRQTCSLRAFAVLGLALCLLLDDAASSADVQEVRALVQHIHRTLGLSASRALQLAWLLYGKYTKAVDAAAHPSTLPPLRDDMAETLAVCFDRALPTDIA